MQDQCALFIHFCRSPATDTWRLVWSRHGPEDILWQTAEGIPVSACSDYHVVFEATIPYGISANGTGDVAVDHIVFCEVLGESHCGFVFEISFFHLLRV